VEMKGNKIIKCDICGIFYRKNREKAHLKSTVHMIYRNTKANPCPKMLTDDENVGCIS